MSASSTLSPPSAARRIVWTPIADRHLSRMRADGASLRAMAQAFGLSRSTIAERAARLGLVLPTRPVPAVSPKAPSRSADDPAHDPAREALPAGHPISWGMITAGTCLEGTAYPSPIGKPVRSAQTEVAAR